MNIFQKANHNLYHFDHFELSHSHIILLIFLIMYLLWVLFLFLEKQELFLNLILNKRFLLNKV